MQLQWRLLLQSVQERYLQRELSGRTPAALLPGGPPIVRPSAHPLAVTLALATLSITLAGTMYAALASQKHHMAVYLTGIYMDDKAYQRFESAYRATGKRYDVGKSCVRFKKLEDLPLELIGESIALFRVDEFVERVKQIHSDRKPGRK